MLWEVQWGFRSFYCRMDWGKKWNCLWGIEVTNNSIRMQYIRRIRVVFEHGRHEWFALMRIITKLNVLHTRGFLKCCSSRNLTRGRHNTGRNGQLEGHSAKQCVFKYPDGTPIRDGWSTDPITSKIIPPRPGLIMSWLFSVISLQQFPCWKYHY